MFNLNAQKTIKTIALGLGCCFCASLGAQDRQIVVVKPSERSEESRGKLPEFTKNLIRDTYAEYFAEKNGYTLIDVSHTDQLMQEHERQRKGLTRVDEIREFGQNLGADYIITTTVDYSQVNNEYNVHCAFLDVTKGIAIASTNKQIRELNGKRADEVILLSNEMIDNLVKKAEARPTQANSVNARPAPNSQQAILAGLDTEIANMIKNEKSNATWNDYKIKRYSIKVDTSGLTVDKPAANTVVKGVVRFTLIGNDGYDISTHDHVIRQASQMTQREVFEDVKRQLNIKDIIANLVD